MQHRFSGRRYVGPASRRLATCCLRGWSEDAPTRTAFGRGNISWQRVSGPKAQPFAQPRATPWGAGAIVTACRPNGPIVRGTVGPLGRQCCSLASILARALPWAGRTVLLRSSHRVAKESSRAPVFLRLAALTPGPSPASGRGEFVGVPTFFVPVSLLCTLRPMRQQSLKAMLLKVLEH